MAIWITGARGFIGRYLSKQLSKSGSYTIGIGNGEQLVNEKEEWGLKKFVKQQERMWQRRNDASLIRKESKK